MTGTRAETCCETGEGTVTACGLIGDGTAAANVDEELVHISGERYLNSLAGKGYECDRPVCEGYLPYDLGRNYARL